MARRKPPTTDLIVVAILSLFLGAPTTPIHAVVYFGGAGWPEDWPSELEAFRKRALSARFASGSQVEIHQIPFASRAEFDGLWPVLLRLKSKGAPITIRNVGSGHEYFGSSDWGDSRPIVRILAPPQHMTTGYTPMLDEAGNSISSERMKLFHRHEAGGVLTREERAILQAEKIVGDPVQLDIEAMKTDNRLWLEPGPPWSDEIRNEKGELPKCVRAEMVDGRLRWTTNTGRICIQCRIELELVVDGRIIDLERLEIPEDTPIIDEWVVKSPPAR